MRKLFFWLSLLALPATGAELSFDLGEFATNGPPAGFRGVLYGHGRPVDWQVVMDAVPPAIAPATDKAPMVTQRAVLTQVNRDPTDERFPLLIYDGDTFGDFTLTTRFKISDGLMEQVAGIAFRIQNETNFYVVYANAMDSSLGFYKVINGVRTPLHGSSVPVTLGKWHQLQISCRGNAIDAGLDGTEAIKLISTTFSSGKIGFWTKSDSRCSFTDTHITYQLREPMVQSIVRETLAKYSKLRDLKIYLPDANNELHVAAAKNPSELGKSADKPEQEMMKRTTVFVAKTRTETSVVLPLHDRNGDNIGAITVGLEPFPGQTDENAIYRAMVVGKEIEQQGKTLEELRE